MMLNRQSIPDLNRGLEPCGAAVVPISTCVWQQGVAVRRTPLGRGAAKSRSNVAHNFPWNSGGHFWPFHGDYYDGQKFASGATAPSLENLVATLGLQASRCTGSDSDVLFTFVGRLSATSKSRPRN